jgi:hypothetical protein
MVVRLAFSVLAHVDPTILIVDEALSVGDIFFQQKCYRKIREGLDTGLTLLFVSHDEATLKSFCKTGVLLSQGCCDYAGAIEECTRRYLKSARSGAPSQDMVTTTAGSYTNDQLDKPLLHACTITVVNAMRTDLDIGSGKLKITDFWYASADGRQRLSQLDPLEPITFQVMVKTNERILHPCLGFMLKNSNGLCVFSIESDSLLLSQESLPPMQAENSYLITMTFQMPPLKSGEYAIDLALADGLGVNHQQCHWTYDSHFVSVVNPSLSNGCVGSSTTTFSLASNPAPSPTASS